MKLILDLAGNNLYFSIAINSGELNKAFETNNEAFKIFV